MTVVSPLLTDRVDNSITTPGHTLEVAFNEKCRDYLEACEREGISFIPLPVETLGGWHKKAVEQLRKLARAQARSSGKEEDDAIRHLFQRLGVLLVKRNAALMLNRIPFIFPPRHRWRAVDPLFLTSNLPRTLVQTNL